MGLKFLKACVACAMVYLPAVGTAQAATVNIVRVADNPQETVYGIRDNTGTDGVDLDGAIFTATYADGTSEEIVWNALRTFNYSIDGEAAGTDTYVYMSWDGFEMTTTRLLTSLLIQLAPASSVFDTTFIFDPDPASTPGSSFGYPFELYSAYSGLQGSITATYSGIVNMAGDVARGDLFTDMLVDFSGLSTGGILGAVSFRSDMDTLRYAGDLTPISPVPLPAGFWLLLAGMGGFVLSGRMARRGSAARVSA